MPKIVFDFDTETKLFRQIGNTDVLTAMHIMLDVVNELINPNNIPEIKSETKEVKTG